MLNFSVNGDIYNWLEVGEDGGIISYRYIRLDDVDRNVVWGIPGAWNPQGPPCGRWSYQAKLGTGHYFLEFSASRAPIWRKHILSEFKDGHYILRPYDEAPDDYDDEELWHDTSVMHRNRNTIIMSKVEMPWIENEGLPPCVQRLLHG